MSTCTSKPVISDIASRSPSIEFTLSSISSSDPLLNQDSEKEVPSQAQDSFLVIDTIVADLSACLDQSTKVASSHVESDGIASTNSSSNSTTSSTAETPLLSDTLIINPEEIPTTINNIFIDRAYGVSPLIEKPSLNVRPSTLNVSEEIVVLVHTQNDGVTEEARAHQEALQHLQHLSQPTNQTSENKRWIVWLVLFFYVLAIGGGQVLFRLQVVLYGDQVFTVGTFLCFVVLGTICGQSVYIIKQVRYLLRRSVQRPTWKIPVLGFCAGSLSIIGLTLYIIMTEDGGEASLLSPLTAIFIVIPVIYGVFGLGDKLNIPRGIGVFLAIASAAFFAMSNGGNLSFNTRTLSLFLGSVGCWGVCTVLDQVFSIKPPNGYAAGFLGHAIGLVSTAIIIIWAVSGGADFHVTPAHVIVFVAGMARGLGSVTFFLLARSMPEEAAVVAPLSSLYVLVPVTVGMTALGEAVGPWKLAGIVASVAGVLLMGVRDWNIFLPSACNRKLKSKQTDNTSIQKIENFISMSTISDCPLEELLEQQEPAIFDNKILAATKKECTAYSLDKDLAAEVSPTAMTKLESTFTKDEVARATAERSKSGYQDELPHQHANKSRFISWQFGLRKPNISGQVLPNVCTSPQTMFVTTRIERTLSLQPLNSELFDQKLEHNMLSSGTASNIDSAFDTLAHERQMESTK
eukprot:gene2101-8002_t